MKRLYYLDNFRALCMMLGFFVHASTLADFGVLEYLAGFSNLFRMAAFFAISGYLSAMMLQSRSVRRYLSNRLTSLAVPLVVTLSLLNPVTLYLMFQWHNGASFPHFGFSEVLLAVRGMLPGTTGPMVWHLHLWFLFSLICYVLTAPPAFAQAGRICKRLDWLASTRWKALIPFFTAVAITGTVIFMRLTYEVLVAPHLDAYILNATLTFWPFFLLGLFSFAAPAFWNSLHTIDIPTVLCAVAFFALSRSLPGSPLRTLAEIAAISLARCAIIFAFLWLFRRVLNWTNPLLTSFADSIYTAYLLHYCAIHLMANLFYTKDTIGSVGFFTIALSCLALTWLFHVFCVQPNSVLRFFLNGKMRAAIPAQASQRTLK